MAPSSAFPTVADTLGPGKLKMVAQGIEQSHTRLEFRLQHFAVDVERNRRLARTVHRNFLAFDGEYRRTDDGRNGDGYRAKFEKVAT